MFKNMKKKSLIQKELKKNNIYFEFNSSDLERNFKFVLLTMPEEYTKNIVFVEEGIDVGSSFETIKFHAKDNAYSIKKKIGIHLLEKNKIPEFDSLSTSLLAKDKIKLNFLESSYGSNNPLTIFKELTTDIFAFFCAAPEFTEEEVANTINSIYLKNHVNQNYSKQKEIDSLFDL